MLIGFFGPLLLIWAAALTYGVARAIRRQPPAPVEPPGPVERLVRASVLVTLKSGASFGGVLYEADEHGLVLRNAQAYGKETVSVDGEVFVLLRDVDYIQKP